MFLATTNIPVPCKRANGDQPSERVSVFTVYPSADRRMAVARPAVSTPISTISD